MSSSSAAHRIAAACLGLALGLAALGTAPAGELPESLGQWYKPSNARQVWLHTMFSLRRELQAVREYAALEDGERLRQWAGRLDEHYRSLASMVPEWNDEVEAELAADLLEQARRGDFAAIERSADRLERSCRSCHRQYQALAALRHRWPSFDMLRVGDAQGREHDLTTHMESMSVAVNRIRIASEDQRWDVATQAADTLAGQLEALAATCQACHDDSAPRERILGAETSATLATLRQSLDAQDPRGSARQLGSLAVQTCARCHSVHRIATQIQRQLFER
jgi:cytochrome c556